MKYDKFYNWLILKKQMNNLSAKDVLSRCRRVLKITNQEKIDHNTLELIIGTNEFERCSNSIKSQLKRAVTLYNDFCDEQGN